MKLYKVLGKNGNAVNGGHGRWHLPKKKKDGTWIPGKWMPEIKGELIPCENGYHLCRKKDLIGWLNETIYEAEYSGERLTYVDKVVVRRVRLLRKYENWNEKTARLFAADCAEHILFLFEEKYPGDDRPQRAIAAARLFANKKITRVKWAAARAAAGAARAAAGEAARAAAGDAARDAEIKWQKRHLNKLMKQLFRG